MAFSSGVAVASFGLVEPKRRTVTRTAILGRGECTGAWPSGPAGKAVGPWQGGSRLVPLGDGPTRQHKDQAQVRTARRHRPRLGGNRRHPAFEGVVCRDGTRVVGSLDWEWALDDISMENLWVDPEYRGSPAVLLKLIRFLDRRFPEQDDQGGRVRQPAGRETGRSSQPAAGSATLSDALKVPQVCHFGGSRVGCRPLENAPL